MLKIPIDNVLSDGSYFVSREAINVFAFKPLWDYPVFYSPNSRGLLYMIILHHHTEGQAPSFW